MSIRKFWFNVIGRDDSANENETDVEEEEITESEETASTEKRVRFLGIPFYKFFYKRMSKRCLKFLFLTLSGTIFLTGLTAIATSVWMLADEKLVSRLIGERLFNIILLLTGILMILTSFLGIIGVAKKRRKILVAYIVVLGLFLSMIIICAALSFVFFDKITHKVQNDMMNSIGSYRSLARAAESWDNTQKYLKCCGVKSYKDWANYRVSIPQSCCWASIHQCLRMTENIIYKTGCLKRAVLLLKSYVHAVVITAMLLFLVLLLSLFLAVGVRKRIKSTRFNPR